MRGSPKCIFSAARFSSCHFAVGTVTRLRVLQKSTSAFSSTASLAQPFRATMAFSRGDGSSHFHKAGVDLSIQQLVMPPAGACWRRLLLPLCARFSVKKLHLMQVSSKSSFRLVAYFSAQQMTCKRRGKS